MIKRLPDAWDFFLRGHDVRELSPKTLACGSMRLLFLKVLTLCITYDVELSSKYKRDLIAVA